MLRAPMYDSSLRSGKRCCSSLPAEFAIALPSFRGVISMQIDQDRAASVLLTSLPLPEDRNSVFYWSMTRYLRSKPHYAKIWVSFIFK